MAEYSRIAKGHFTSTGSAQVINLPFQPDRIEMLNYTATATPANHGIPRAWWDVSMGQGFGLVLINNTTPVLTSGVVLANGFSTFAAGQLLQYGPINQHGSAIGDFSITAASPSVVTTTNAHGLVSGDVIVFSNLYQTSTTGMQQMAGVPLTVTVTNGTTFSVNWNSSGSNYTAFNTSTSTNNVGSYKQVLYPYLYAPEVAVITAINTSTNVITTGAAHNYQVGQEVGFHIPAAWGSTQLNELPNTLIPGSPQYFYVTAVTQNTFTVSASLSSVTAFNPNQAFNSFPGLKFPYVVAASDINSGGVAYSGGNLYPSPLLYNGLSNTQASTINGPAIQGAFVNATSQGFIIGAGNAKVGAASTDTSSFLVGANADVIYWTAYLSDLAVN